MATQKKPRNDQQKSIFKNIFASPFEFEYPHPMAGMDGELARSGACIVGMNQVTRRLQKNINAGPTEMNDESRLICVFLCKLDIKVSELYGHLPALCHFNKIPLVVLQKGAEEMLAKKLKIKSALALGITAASNLAGRVAHLPPVYLKWLDKPTQIFPLCINQVEMKLNPKRKRNAKSLTSTPCKRSEPQEIHSDVLPPNDKIVEKEFP